MRRRINSTSSLEVNKDTIKGVRNVTRMIHKMNLMVVPIQVEDILFNIDGQEKNRCFGYDKDCQNKLTPRTRKRGARFNL